MVSWRCWTFWLVACVGCESLSGRGGGVLSRTSESDDSPPELAMLALVNKTRAEYNLKALRWNDDLARVAWEHSRDMHASRFFSHVSPNTGTMSDRAKRAGVRYRRLTENIAWASAPWSMDEHIRTAHTNLMNSPGHRKNILDPDVSEVGMGFYWKGREFFVTQLFRKPVGESRRPRSGTSRWAAGTGAGEEGDLTAESAEIGRRGRTQREGSEDNSLCALGVFASAVSAVKSSPAGTVAECPECG